MNRVLSTGSDTVLLAILAPLIADLADELPASLRYQRLLEALQRLLPCDAVALLRLDGEVLAPLALRGLSPDTLGRRYRIGDHPRLRAILDAPGSLLFPPDCDLPDPYDGLVLRDPSAAGDGARLEVHDCMGCALRVHDRLWGVLTLDDLSPGRFAPADQRLLETFSALAAATVATSTRLEALVRDVADERRRAEAYRLALAPVQELIVVDYLPATLDYATLDFGSVEYGDRFIPVPAGVTTFTTRDLPPNDGCIITGHADGQLAVDVNLSFNPVSGRIELRLKVIDTALDDWPYDPYAGILPPPDIVTCGRGSITYTVRPRADTPDYTIISNKASVIFDTNAPNDTNTVWNLVGP